MTLFMSNLYRFQLDNESAWKENLAGLQTSLNHFEQELGNRETPFFSGIHFNTIFQVNHSHEMLQEKSQECWIT